MIYHFKYFSDESGGYWAKCIELEGCITQGETIEELKKNMEEVLNLVLSEPVDSKIIFSLPKKNLKGKNILKIPVNPKIAFATLLRQYRLKNGFTQRQIAKKLGKELYSYQKLESIKTANPTLKTLSLIKKVFPDFKLEIVFNMA